MFFEILRILKILNLHVTAFHKKYFGNRLLFEGSSEFYLYIGITSLCLYNITSFLFFQDGMLSKLTNLFLLKTQICAHQGHFPVDKQSLDLVY